MWKEQYLIIASLTLFYRRHMTTQCLWFLKCCPYLGSTQKMPWSITPKSRCSGQYHLPRETAHGAPALCKPTCHSSSGLIFVFSCNLNKVSSGIHKASHKEFLVVSRVLLKSGIVQSQHCKWGQSWEGWSVDGVLFFALDSISSPRAGQRSSSRNGHLGNSLERLVEDKWGRWFLSSATEPAVPHSKARCFWGHTTLLSVLDSK